MQWALCGTKTVMSFKLWNSLWQAGMHTQVLGCTGVRKMDDKHQTPQNLFHCHMRDAGCCGHISASQTKMDIYGDLTCIYTYLIPRHPCKREQLVEENTWQPSQGRAVVRLQSQRQAFVVDFSLAALERGQRLCVSRGGSLCL